LSETCRFCTSPKSRASERPALSADCTITLRRAERAICLFLGFGSDARIDARQTVVKGRKRACMADSVGAAQIGQFVGVDDNPFTRRK
jgi:hypothetical protein